MPFHPKIEFALNRLGIFPSPDELNLIFHEGFDNWLKLSVDSITDPKLFKLKLYQEQQKEKREREQKQQQQQESGGAEKSLHFSEHANDVTQEQHQHQQLEEEELIQKMQQREHENHLLSLRQHEDSENNNNNNSSSCEEVDDDVDDDEELKVEKEAKRIRDELQKMSLILLDSVRLCVEEISSEKNSTEENEEETEKEVQISNVLLLRFILTMLSDSLVASTFRIPLLQGDLPLLARSILRCCASSSGETSTPTKSNVASHQLSLFNENRKTIIFLLLDMIATMVADSAACRLSFACCVEPIVQVLNTFVIVSENSTNANSQRTSSSTTTTTSSSAATTKKPVTFVFNSASSSSNTDTKQKQEDETSNNASSALQTTENDVIFAGVACLETMLFHCSDAIESFVDGSENVDCGVKVFVKLFKQVCSQKRKEEQKNPSTSSSSSIASSSATEITSFIKRTLIHCRLSGVISEERWSEILGSKNNKTTTSLREHEENKSSSSSTTTKASQAAALAAKMNENVEEDKKFSKFSSKNQNNNSNISSNSVFGRQGDDIDVDELRWSLSSVKIGVVPKV